MRIIYIYYTACLKGTQTVAPTIPGFQGLNICIQYLDSHPHKPIFYPSNYYHGSNLTRLICSGNQVEYYTTHNCLEFYKVAYHDRLINIIRSVSFIIHTLIGVAVLCKLHI